MSHTPGTDDAPERPATAAAGRMLTPADIQQKEFRVARLGGYKMRDVDEYLDELTLAVGALLEENEHLRAQSGMAPMVGAPDLDDVSRQADEIIERARREAARILAGAEGGAPGAGGSSAGAGEPERAAVNAFLTQERAFLQGLAALVQGHAESVKGMARRARQIQAAPTAAAAEPSSDDEPDDEPGSTPEPEAAEPPPEAPVTQPIRPPAAAEATDEPIRLDEPTPAGAGKAPDAEGDNSLRELFWGDGD